MSNLKVPILWLSLTLCGFVYNPPTQIVQYSKKPYTVKNSFGRHTYRPDQGYRINYRYRSGQASYYGGKFHGRKTAGCIIFDQNQLLAAHPTALIPSIAKITRLDNGKHIHVIIVDRGPFAKGRICDLSVGAALALGSKEKGHVPVKIEVLATQSKILATQWKKFLNKRLPDQLFQKISSPMALRNYLRRIS